MSGNMWAWVWDTWREDAYIRGDCTDPVVDRVSFDRVTRDGCWNGDAQYTHASIRDRNSASVRTDLLGFRFMRSVLSNI